VGWDDPVRQMRQVVRDCGAHHAIALGELPRNCHPLRATADVAEEDAALLGPQF